MNFLLRTTSTTQPVVPDVSSMPQVHHDKISRTTPKAAATLEGLIAEDPYTFTGEEVEVDGDGAGDASGATSESSSKGRAPVGNHVDVSREEGWIIIPFKELPAEWNNAANILQLQSLDRHFVFPGEQIHILVCLSASNQETEVITPFRVAAVMSRSGKSSPNGKQELGNKENKSRSTGYNGSASGTYEESPDQIVENNDEAVLTQNHSSPKKDISATESLLRMEDHKQQTENILERFRNSNFFVRIAESDEQLWSKRNVPFLNKSMTSGEKNHSNGESTKDLRSNPVNAIIDKGYFGGNASGGLARNTIKCFSLSNGDIVVLLQVNVGISDLKDPVLEVLQFEKCQPTDSSSEHVDNMPISNHDDPCGELLNWLYPLDRTLPPPRPLSPPLSSSISQKLANPASGSQIFSFGNFRSYSMPSLPQVGGVPISTTKPTLDHEDFDCLSTEKTVKNLNVGNEGLLSFRGVTLEPERFSVHCGLEGIYLPGRRWRRKFEIVQPVEIHSFAAECTTEDLLCVQIKNVSPDHIPDLVIYLDAITIVYEEASNGSSPVSLPIASIESGNGHSLPDLALRRGEEHSFILKMASTRSKTRKVETVIVPHSKMGFAGTVAQKTPNGEGRNIASIADHFSIMISCRCNYTESKLFFKQPTDWRPQVARDLMISVASEPYPENIGVNARVPQLPVQVLTLKATNLTSGDLTLTVLAPESSVSPSVLSLTSTPKAPLNSSFKNGSGSGKLSSPLSVTNYEKESYNGGKRSNNLDHWTAALSDAISSNNLGFTHLWLQSTVPLGCVPARSSAAVKLELLPLTGGIITLDTLQIAVKEKGLTYIPEQSLKIYATSSIANRIS